MLDIENFNWSDLHDAYGKASAIPNLIKSVTNKINSSENSQSGPWFELWSRLCHQGTIYDASCAAVPYIVAAIPNRKTSINMNFFLLPMCIEISRQQNSKYIIPERFRDDYATALEKIDDLASIYESNEDNEQFKKILKATHLVISGNIEDAENVLDE